MAEGGEGGEDEIQFLRTLRLIHQLHPYLENDCLATVTHALVTSRLDFCNALYMGLPLKTVRILQLVQNRAARLLTGTGRCSHITPVLCQLHWLPVEVWAQFKVLVMTYKALNGLRPGYLKERLCPYMPARPLRSAADALFREPSMKDIRRSYQAKGIFKLELGAFDLGMILEEENIIRKAGLDELQVGIKIARRNINKLRYADDTTLVAESEEELKSLLMWVKEESTNVGLKLNIKKTKIMASGPITSWQIDGEEMEVVTDFIFLGSKITADGDCSQEIKGRLLLGRKAMANLDSILKSRDIILPTKVRIVKAMVFPVAINLYAGQEAAVRTGHGTTDWFKIEKGVRQGCIPLPCLLYAEHIMRKAGLDETQVGIKIAGRNINNLRYADDTTLMAESEEELKSLLMRVKESTKVGLKLNIKKTKMMASSPLTSWQIDGEEMEDDEVVLQCVANIHKEQRKFCLAAEGLGNRLCFLEPTSEAKKEKRKHCGSDKSSGHKKPKKDKAEKPTHKPKKPDHPRHRDSGSSIPSVPTAATVPTPTGPALQMAMQVTLPGSPRRVVHSVQSSPEQPNVSPMGIDFRWRDLRLSPSGSFSDSSAIA
ncbi:Ryanodine receptor 3 [Varanus komodoensis]|nr:Ryanodine receptor 3 [Varanus komodoensis]